MSRSEDGISQVLQARGLNITHPRIALFKLLEEGKPLSVSEIYHELAGEVDRASVYRAINLFVDLGVAHKINLGWKYKIELSDAFVEHHHHFTCAKCHKVIALNEAELESFIDRLARRYKFSATAHQIEIQGLCEKCKKGRVKSGKN